MKKTVLFLIVLFTLSLSGMSYAGQFKTLEVIAGYAAGFLGHEISHEEMGNHHGGLCWTGNILDTSNLKWNFECRRISQKTKRLIAFSGFVGQDDLCRWSIGQKKWNELSPFDKGLAAFSPINTILYLSDNHSRDKGRWGDLAFFRKNRREKNWAEFAISAAALCRTLSPFSPRNSLLRKACLKVSSNGTPMLGVEWEF